MTPKILHRRQRLVVTIEKLIKDPSFVDLNCYEKERTCGTYRCVAGWYRFWELGLGSRDSAYISWASIHFNIPPSDAQMLFGSAYYGPLEERLELAKELANEA